MSTNRETLSESSETNIKPETVDKYEKYRIYASISFVVVLIVIGLPLWWKTTAVYRVSLPYTKIKDLDDLDLYFTTNVTIATLDPSRGQALSKELSTFFKTSKLFRMNFTVIQVNKATLAETKDLQNLELSSLSRMKPGEILLFEIPGLTRFTADKVLVGKRRIVYFSTDATALKIYDVLQQWLLQEDLMSLTQSALSQTGGRDKYGRQRLPPANSYELLVTAVNPAPEYLHMPWNLKEIISDYLDPFLKQLSALSQFTVRSQWLYFVSLGVQPNKVEDGYELEKDMLPHILIPLEKKLASHITSNPCIHLLVYVPPCYEAPLRINHGDKNPSFAFHSPRWGGIIIENPNITVCGRQILDPVVVEPDWHKLSGIWLQQLRELIGVPHHESIPLASMHPLSSMSLRQWELDSLYRIRVLEHLGLARLTLQSLSALLAEISNIVIEDAVGASVWKAVNSLEEGAQLLREGKLTKALATSKQAFLSAEAAFSDPSLLALLYFPDDQKYAVYIPLFLPVMIPVFISLKNYNSWFSVGRPGKLKTE